MAQSARRRKVRPFGTARGRRALRPSRSCRFAISKFLTKEFSVGALAGYYQQVTGDGGEGNGIGPFKGRVPAIGATAAYTFNVGRTPIAAKVRVLRETDVEKRRRGTIGLFTLAVPIGGQARPAAG